MRALFSQDRLVKFELLWHHRSIWYLATFSWAGMIFLLSSQNTLPGPDIISWDFVLKKCAHIFVYGVLFFLTYRSLHFHSTDERHITFFSFILVLAFAVSDEYHQSLVAGRTATLKDIGYDLLGMYLSWLKLSKYV